MIKEKKRLYNAFFTGRDPAAFKAFKVYRNNFKKPQRQSQRNYYFTMFEGVTNAEMWNRINAVISARQPENNIDELTICDNVYKGAALANKFN